MTPPVGARLSEVSEWVRGLVDAAATPAGIAAIAAILALGAAARVVVERAQQRRMHFRARLITVRTPPEVPADAAAAWWAGMAGLLRPRLSRLLFGQPHLSFEYVITPDSAVIQIWVPGQIPPGMIERSIAAAWPGATTRTTTSRPPRSTRDRHAVPRTVSACGVLRLARPPALPINAATAGDPIAALLTAAAPTPPPTPEAVAGSPTSVAGEARGARSAGRVVVQVMARPVPARRAGHHGHTGAGRILDFAGRVFAAVAREGLTLLSPGPIRERTRSARSESMSAGDPRGRLERSSTDRAAVAKALGAGFETLVRYAVTTPIPPAKADTAQARAEAVERARRHVRGNAHAVASTFAAFTGHNFYRRHRLRCPVDTIAGRQFGRGDLLSAAELAAIAALPVGHVPHLARARARSVAPPPGIPRPGPGVKPLGDTTPDAATSAGRRRPVGVSVADARHHLHVIGATGTGKSTLLVQLILADIRARRGTVVIDPKGDLVTDVLTHLPPTLRQRAVVIDPDRPGPVPCLNPLNPPRHAGGPGGRDGDSLVVENLVTIFQRVFAASWGPRTDDVMRAACLTLRAQPTPRSLLDLPVLLSDPDMRVRQLRAVADPVLRGFWDWYEHLSEPARAQIAAPLMNKVRAMLLRPFLRALLSDAPTGAVDLSGVLDGGVLLARLPKGALGDEGTRLVGSILVAHTWAATTARAAQPAELRRDASLVIDECHNFLNLPHSLDDILAEARGLRLSVVLAHQNLAQLGRDLRDAISANARNKLIFNVGPEDARELARHTQPHLGEHDLANLDAYTAAARLVTNGAETAAFTLHTRPLPARRHT